MKKSKVVVDSSVVIKWLFSDDEKYVEHADKILEDAELGKIKLYVPELSKYEVGNAIWKKSIATQQAKDSLATYYSLPLNFTKETEDRAQKSYEIARKLEITYYDASFITLAQELEAVLITDNFKHQGKSTQVTVIALKDY